MCGARGRGAAVTGDANRNRLVAFGPELVLARCPSRGAAAFGRENPCHGLLGAFQADTGMRDGQRAMRLCQVSREDAESKGGYCCCVEKRGAFRSRGWIALDTTLGYPMAPTYGFMNIPSCSY